MTQGKRNALTHAAHILLHQFYLVQFSIRLNCTIHIKGLQTLTTQGMDYNIRLNCNIKAACIQNSAYQQLNSQTYEF
jgi:hypothetical protein